MALLSYRRFIPDNMQNRSLSRAKILFFDDTHYIPQLHAGILLCDGEQLTTSGCPIFHPDDPSQYMYSTIASHGFITGAEVVLYSSGNSRVIAIKSSGRAISHFVAS